GEISTRKMEANTVLSLTNVRTTETIAVQDGYAAKNSISFGGGGGGFWGAGGAALVGGGYDSTDIGRIVTLAFIQAYGKMVTDLGLVTAGSAGTAEASPTRTFTAQEPVAMRVSAAAGAKDPPPIANYWMDVATTSGMGAGMTPGGRPDLGQIMGMMSGGGSSVGHTLDLRLASRTKAPDLPQADHLIPAGLQMGPSLPL